MGTRSVVVVLPFGGKDSVERRRAILNFKRLEHLVRNMCHVKPAVPTGTTDEVVYDVEVAKTAMDDVPTKALQQIKSADILIALAVEPNVNVAYEIAYRQANDRLLGILIADSESSLPLYVRSLAYHTWEQKEVLGQIGKIANDKSRDLPDFKVRIPDELQRFIEFYDGMLRKGLESALQEIENKMIPEPIEAVRYLQGIISNEIISYYPRSIVEVSFSRRGEFSDPASPGIVWQFDDRFSHLFGYANKAQAEVDAPLTLIKLLDRLKGYLDADRWDEFSADQKSLTDIVVKADGFARAKIPIVFNTMHPHRGYKEMSFLPCIVAQVVDGRPDGQHKKYLLVIYIDLETSLA